MHKKIKKFTEICLNALYPRCCPFCHRILKDQSLLICEDCMRKVGPVAGPRCMRCSKPVEEDVEYCRECAGSSRGFHQGKGIYPYTEKMRMSLVRFKDQGRRQYGEFFGKAMYVYGRKELERWKPDLLVPVPLHRKKQRVRGFNQSEYLARQVSRFSGIPLAADLVIKPKATKSQKKLDAASRRRNLKGAFVCTRPLHGQRVLVIDDVYTTGSTMEAMADCLKRQGADQVYFLTLCIGQG